MAFFAGFLPIAPVAVATGSMEPTIYAGDVVLICQTDSSQLEVGDIIQYRKDDYTVIHRIIECKTEENEIIGFITKGDYNNGPDSEVVLPEQVIGRVIEVIPGAGKFTLWLHNQLYAV